MLTRVATTIVVIMFAAGCTSSSSPVPVSTHAPKASLPAPRPTTSPHATSAPTGSPIPAIEHATGPADVVLRFDSDPGDFGICELCGGWYGSLGPEFTLYGDGRVITQYGRTQPPTAEGPIVRGLPFMIADLDEEEVQEFLRFALGEGGLGTASESYETSTDTDDPRLSTFTVRAGDLDKRIDIHGPNPFEAFVDYLRNFAARSGTSTEVWVPDRYWGLLIEASSWIEVEVVPAPPETAIAAWPWEGIPPWVVGTAMDPIDENGRRVMSRAEASVLGLSDNGGVVQQVYLRAPDGETIYSFSLWPMLPDETGAP